MSHDQELENWLSKATAGLCDEAKVRIATEIESHVREAVADLRERGTGEADAMRGAVATLGNVKKARRAFRRIHLTEWEAITVRRANRNEPLDPQPPYGPQTTRRLLVPLVLICIIGAIIDAELRLSIVTLGAIAVVFGVLPVVVRRMLHRPRPKRSPARIVLDRAISFLTIIILLAISASLSHLDIGQMVSDGVIKLLIASLCLSYAYRYLRLWRKLKCDPSLVAAHIPGDDETQSPSSV